jgi:basic amino acid/polyamine antiporter, APA family
MITVIASSGNISGIASTADFSIFFVYAIVNISLIWLRFKNLALKRSFVTPIRVGKFPILVG